MAPVHTIVEHHVWLAPLLAESVKRRTNRAWVGEVDFQEKAVARAVFLLERASCKGDSVTIGQQGLRCASANVLAGADDESDGFAHGHVCGGVWY